MLRERYSVTEPFIVLSVVSRKGLEVIAVFNLYDLPNCLNHSQARMYAYDTHLTLESDTHSVLDIDQNLSQDLASVREWLTANKLTLNHSKTEFMLISSTQKSSTFNSSPFLQIWGPC